MKPSGCDSTFIRNHVFMRDCIYEVRILGTNEGTVSGYFDNEKDLNAAVEPWDGKAKGIYSTMNPVMPELFGRAPNRLVTSVIETTKDIDIARRLRMLIDFDPVREAGVSSTEAEHQAALEKMRKVRAFLTSLGWPEPIECDSGNGGHLIYSIDLPNDAESTSLVKAVLKVLAAKFDDDVVKVDKGVHNAARITKLYGTMTGKGPDTDDRPHRRSAILSQPLEFLAVPHELLQAISKKKANNDERKRGRPRKDDPLRRRYSLEEVREMLRFVPADSRDNWRNFGIILGREFDRSDEAWELYNSWSDKWDGVKESGHDENMHQCFYKISQESAEKELSLGTIIKAALDNGWVPKTGDVPIDDFIYSAPDNDFLYRPTMQHWAAAAVDAAVSPVNRDGKIVKASHWLRAKRRVTSLACDPDLDEGYILGKNCVDGVILPGVGAAVLNMYRRPNIQVGDAVCAKPFVEHCERLFNKQGDCDQFLDYLAHRRQKPGEKPRFGLLIAGDQGIGKDTAVEFCAPAIGVWNITNISPAALTSPFNEYGASTLVRINETANAQEISRWAFNEAVKVLIAGSPDFYIVNPKYGCKYTVRLHCGVIITTNHLTSGIFIPEDDRRYDVLECATKAEMGLEDDAVRRAYFEKLWGWFYEEDGARHVAAFLEQRDLTHFNAALGQRKTLAHRSVVQCGLMGDEWAADAVERCWSKEMISGSVICQFAEDAGERRENVNARVSHALRRLGYEVYPNPDCKDGRWKIGGKLHKIFKLREHRPEKGWETKLSYVDGGFSCTKCHGSMRGIYCANCGTRRSEPVGSA